MTTPGHYFDCNATTPMSEAARQAWVNASSQHWQNPSSLYRDAGAVRRLLEDARIELADLLGVEEEEMVFTSGATEANNAVMEYCSRLGGEDSCVVISSIEHPSVREAAEKWYGKGRLREVGVDQQGRLCLSELGDLLSDGEVNLVSVMAANNETGVVQPWQEVAKMCREREVAYHCDAAQWIGKKDLPGLEVCDFLTGSAHKFGGPKGTGFLRAGGILGKDFRSLVGGPQEEGKRAGTENYPAIAAMMVALNERQEDLVAGNYNKCLQDRKTFETRVTKELPEMAIVAADAERLWNTVMLVLPESGPSNLKWLIRLDRLGFAVSTGSACSAGKGNPSLVMESMGLDFDQMSRVLRISGEWQTEGKDWDALVDALLEVWEELKSGKRMEKKERITPSR